MSTLFVAYGEPGRETVLTVAAERAAAAGDALFVYHVQETPDESADEVRAEIERVLAATAPDVKVDIEIAVRAEHSEDTNVSRQKLVTDALLAEDREFAYAVMGDVERGSVDGFVHASLTEAVLATHAVPVLLVPV
ncbi:universal stress protein [Halosegnis sp.]|uniref:universal stress protein n=1 Tax=Halosegnis sp. TaxID=2864959 RepID=UPI0035D4DC6D